MPQEPLIIDRFTRANSPTLGLNWTQSHSSVGILSNAAIIRSGQFIGIIDHCIENHTLSKDSQICEIFFRRISTVAGLILVSNGVNDGYKAVADFEASTLFLYARDGSADTLLTSNTFGPDTFGGGGFGTTGITGANRMKMEAIFQTGQPPAMEVYTINVWINDKIIVSYSDGVQRAFWFARKSGFLLGQRAGHDDQIVDNFRSRGVGSSDPVIHNNPDRFGFGHLLHSSFEEARGGPLYHFHFWRLVRWWQEKESSSQGFSGLPLATYYLVDSSGNTVETSADPPGVVVDEFRSATIDSPPWNITGSYVVSGDPFLVKVANSSGTVVALNAGSIQRNIAVCVQSWPSELTERDTNKNRGIVLRGDIYVVVLRDPITNSDTLRIAFGGPLSQPIATADMGKPVDGVSANQLVAFIKEKRLSVYAGGGGLSSTPALILEIEDDQLVLHSGLCGFVLLDDGTLDSYHSFPLDITSNEAQATLHVKNWWSQIQAGYADPLQLVLAPIGGTDRLLDIIGTTIYHWTRARDSSVNVGQKGPQEVDWVVAPEIGGFGWSRDLVCNELRIPRLTKRDVGPTATGGGFIREAYGCDTANGLDRQFCTVSSLSDDGHDKAWENYQNASWAPAGNAWKADRWVSVMQVNAYRVTPGFNFVYRRSYRIKSFFSFAALPIKTGKSHAQSWGISSYYSVKHKSKVYVDLYKQFGIPHPITTCDLFCTVAGLESDAFSDTAPTSYAMGFGFLDSLTDSNVLDLVTGGGLTDFPNEPTVSPAMKNEVKDEHDIAPAFLAVPPPTANYLLLVFHTIPVEFTSKPTFPTMSQTVRDANFRFSDGFLEFLDDGTPVGPKTLRGPHGTVSFDTPDLWTFS